MKSIASCHYCFEIRCMLILAMLLNQVRIIQFLHRHLDFMPVNILHCFLTAASLTYDAAHAHNVVNVCSNILGPTLIPPLTI